MAINIGGSGPICDAFAKETAKCGSNEVIAGVGACKIKNCQFNDCLMCTAPGINVELHSSQALCATFKPR